MLAAAVVEWYRLKLFHEGKVLSALGGNHSQSVLNHRDGGGVVDMNVFWQVPQYLLVGLSEVSTPFTHLPSPAPPHTPPPVRLGSVRSGTLLLLLWKEPIAPHLLHAFTRTCLSSSSHMEHASNAATAVTWVEVMSVFGCSTLLCFLFICVDSAALLNDC